MEFLEQFDTVTGIVFTILSLMYMYQMFYILISIIKRKVKQLPDAHVNHRYAVMISARNEEGVIGELLDSLAKQNYAKEDYDVYVIADNCTDHTADAAAAHGADVYVRNNTELVGKGYALNELYHYIVKKTSEDAYDAFVVFDADNIVDENFLKEMNKKFDTGKYDALTTYRNTKNFATNWLTAAYSTWFMHEARHLNYVRDMLGAQAMISGTGFVVSSRLMKENDGWPYYFMTEDIQFSVVSTIQGFRIGYCDSAVLYDEQPSTMSQSWKQRLRWAKGFYQIDAKYLGSLIKGFVQGHGSRKLSFYDIFMTCLPCSLLTVAIVGMGVWLLFSAFAMPYYIRLIFQRAMLRFILSMVVQLWIGMMVLGGLTVISEWKRIPASTWDKIRYIPMFPMYMLTYIPISVHALFVKVKWTPIQHYSTAQLAMGQKQK